MSFKVILSIIWISIRVASDIKSSFSLFDNLNLYAIDKAILFKYFSS